MIYKGIKINFNDLKNYNKLAKIIKNYDYIYFGSEFCENLLDLYQSIKVLKFLNNFDKKICFLTPIITDKTISKFKELLNKLNNLENFYEITVNDFGTLNIVFKEFKNRFKINIGRHLSKHFFLYDKNKTSLRTTFSAEAVKFMYEKFNINRYELSYKKINYKYFDTFDYYFKKFKITFYYPYFLLSTTRTCMIGIKDIKPEEDVKEIICNKECLYSDYIVKSYKIKDNLIISQNSAFIKVYEKNILNKIMNSKIDRLVFCGRP